MLTHCHVVKMAKMLVGTVLHLYVKMVLKDTTELVTMEINQGVRTSVLLSVTIVKKFWTHYRNVASTTMVYT